MEDPTVHEYGKMCCNYLVSNFNISLFISLIIFSSILEPGSLVTRRCLVTLYSSASEADISGRVSFVYKVAYLGGYVAIISSKFRV